jgi:hypothetical protein
MELGAYWMVVLVALLVLAMFAQRAIEIYTDVRRYVVRWSDAPAESPADASISAPVETETKAFPSVSNALETPGNSDFRFQSLEAANAYAETLLIDRLAELVLAEKLDKSIAIKVGLRAPTGRAYQAAKERLEAAMQKQQYPTLTASRTKAAPSH